MTDCTAFRPDIVDVALGATPRSALRAHLASCTSCTATLDGARSTLARIDATAGASVAAEPLAGLTQRVVRRIEAAPARRSFSAVGPIAAAAALAVGIAVATGAIPGRHADANRSLAAWRSPTQSLLHSHVSILDTPLHLESGALPRNRS